MKVTVFGATWCAFCKTEKQWLDSKEIEYDYKEVDVDEEAMANMIKLNVGQSVPVTVIENSDDVFIVRGFDRPKLSSLIGI